MPERGENESHLNKLIHALLQTYCTVGNIQLEQLVEEPSSSNEDPAEVAEREKLKKEAVDEARKEKERKFKEKEEKDKKEKARKEKEEKARIENERIEKERIEKIRLANEQIENEKREKERTEQEQIGKERLKRIENERIEKEKSKQEQNVTDFVASPSTTPSAPFTKCPSSHKENLGALAVPEDEKLFTKSDLQQLITDLHLNDKHFISPSDVDIKEQINEGSSAFIFKYDFSIIRICTFYNPKVYT